MNLCSRQLRSGIVMMLCSLIFLSLGAGAAPLSPPRTFGLGIPNHPFTSDEVDIFAYNLNTSDTIGVVNHFWSTACGAGVNFATGEQSGVPLASEPHPCTGRVCALILSLRGADVLSLARSLSLSLSL